MTATASSTDSTMPIRSAPSAIWSAVMGTLKVWVDHVVALGEPEQVLEVEAVAGAAAVVEVGGVRRAGDLREDQGVAAEAQVMGRIARTPVTAPGRRGPDGVKDETPVETHPLAVRPDVGAGGFQRCSRASGSRKSMPISSSTVSEGGGTPRARRPTRSRSAGTAVAADETAAGPGRRHRSWRRDRSCPRGVHALHRFRPCCRRSWRILA